MQQQTKFTPFFTLTAVVLLTNFFGSCDTLFKLLTSNIIALSALQTLSFQLSIEEKLLNEN
jgi:hypothetical protein